MRAPGSIKIPDASDARSRLQLQHNNLGRGAAYRKRSRNSLQEASFRPQKLAVSFPDLDGIAPASKDRRSLSELPPPGHFALEEQTRHKLQHVPPPTQLVQLDLVQLRAEIACLKEIVQELARQTFSKHKADDNNNNNNNNNNTDHNTTNNPNNNNDNNNDNDSSTTSRESSFSSLDLDNENTESSFGSDLDRLSFDSFAHDGETGFSSSDHHGEASSLTTLGETMTMGFSLGSLPEQPKGDDSWDNLGSQLRNG